jgi:hypothetical protein
MYEISIMDISKDIMAAASAGKAETDRLANAAGR